MGSCGHPPPLDCHMAGFGGLPMWTSGPCTHSFTGFAGPWGGPCQNNGLLFTLSKRLLIIPTYCTRSPNIDSPEVHGRNAHIKVGWCKKTRTSSGEEEHILYYTDWISPIQIVTCQGGKGKGAKRKWKEKKRKEKPKYDVFMGAQGRLHTSQEPWP